jgi:predicted DNA-binding transcriptional regulator YafY
VHAEDFTLDTELSDILNVPELSEASTEERVNKFGLKHEAMERIFRLLAFLTANECTRQDIFEHLRIYYRIDEYNSSSRRADRMFERDIKFLEAQGHEIQKVKTRAGKIRYKLVKGSGPNAIFVFSQEEVDNLALLYNLFAGPRLSSEYAKADVMLLQTSQSSRNPFAMGILSFLDRLILTLPSEQKREFQRRTQKPAIYFNLTVAADYLPHHATIDELEKAIIFRQQIRFDYMPTRSKQDIIHHSVVDPYSITYLDGHFYLIGYSQKMNKIFEYRVDRIKAGSIKLLPNMIDVERQRHPIEFLYWIDGDIAKRGLSQRWLTQTAEREEVYVDTDGREKRRVLVRASAYNDWRIIQQLLKYGDQVELVDPPYLRKWMQETVARMHHLYEKK